MNELTTQEMYYLQAVLFPGRDEQLDVIYFDVAQGSPMFYNGEFVGLGTELIQLVPSLQLIGLSAQVNGGE